MQAAKSLISDARRLNTEPLTLPPDSPSWLAKVAALGKWRTPIS